MVYGRILYNSLGKYLLSKTNQLLDYVEVQLDEGGLTPALDGHNHCHDLTSHSSSSCGSISSGRSTPNASCSEASDSDDLTPTNSMTFIPQSSDFTDEGEEETMEQKVLRRCPCTSYHCCGKTGYSTTARVSKKGDQIRISTIHTLRSRNRPNSLVTDYFTSKPIVDSDSESGFSEASDCSGRSTSSVTKRRKSVKFKLEPDVVVFKKDSNTELSHLKTVSFPSLFGSPKIKLLIHTKVPSRSLEDIHVGTSGDRKRTQISRTVTSVNFASNSSNSSSSRHD